MALSGGWARIKPTSATNRRETVSAILSKRRIMGVRVNPGSSVGGDGL
jgi:hypothetical protein